VEISEQATLQARELTGADIRAGKIEELEFPGEYFDVITAWEVIEHIPDVNATLSKIHAWLKPGGLFCMSTPNTNKLKNRISGASRREFFRPPEHLLYFNRRSLRTILQRAGFEVLFVDAGMKSPMYWLGFFKRNNAGSAMARPFERFFDLFQNIGLQGYQLLAFCRKPEKSGTGELS
jgi:SAM-dependent methyltransferase